MSKYSIVKVNEVDDLELHEPEVSNVVFPRKLVKKLILLYKDLPCLWDRDCVAYKHKSKRFEAMTKMTNLVQTYDPSATRVHVLRKIESLRACVRRERKKVKESRKYAKYADEVYKPHLWYYDLFSFVFNDDNEDNEFTYNMNKDEVHVESEDENVEEDNFETIANYASEYNVATSIVEVEENKRYSEFEDDSKSKRHCTEVVDEYDAIGVNVAAKLRNLPPNMRILAEKLINDVLFQAQLNGLSNSTAITTPDPFKRDPL